MPHDPDQDLSELLGWLAAAGAEVGVAPEEVPVHAILDLAKTVAREVLRPGVPVTGFLAGLAVGRGAAPEDVFAALDQRAQQWRNTPISG